MGCIDMKVFIADDSVQIRERLMEMLSEFPEIEIMGEAEGVPEAIRDIWKLNPDVVILDIRMSGGNGMKVLKEVKKNRPHPVVIMLTNHPYPQYRKKCMDLGADHFFDKATEFEKVTEVLGQLIQDSHASRTSAVPGSQQRPMNH
jgi:two-component system chemotaxis response regulator CheY